MRKVMHRGLSDLFLCQNSKKFSDCYSNAKIINNPFYFQVTKKLTSY